MNNFLHFNKNNRSDIFSLVHLQILIDLCLFFFCRRYSLSQFATINFLTGLKMNLSGFSVTYLVLHPSCLKWLLVSMQWKISIWKHPTQLPQISRYLLTAIWLLFFFINACTLIWPLNSSMLSCDLEVLLMSCYSSNLCYLMFLKSSCSSAGEKVGFFFCFNLEHCCVAYAYELLCQDRECNCPGVSKETAGEPYFWINGKIYRNRLRRTMNCLCSACVALFLAVPSASRKLKLKLQQFLVAPQKLPWKSALEVLPGASLGMNIHSRQLKLQLYFNLGRPLFGFRFNPVLIAALMELYGFYSFALARQMISSFISLVNSKLFPVSWPVTFDRLTSLITQ